jgi:chemotaxis protein methyltransferase CheR
MAGSQDWSYNQQKLFTSLVRQRIGLIFPDNRSELLKQGVLTACDLSCETDLQKYYDRLCQTPTRSALWDDLIADLTIGETYFFRNEPHFEALRNVIIPQLASTRSSSRRLRVWSAACSTGEEPYSLAIALREVIPDASSWHLFVLGTDLSRQSLDKARAAIFREWSFRKTPDATRSRYFQSTDGAAVLHPEIRRMVTFGYLNQIEDPYPAVDNNTHAMDIIFCRNLAIYLPEDAIRSMADRFFRCLVPGGYLVVGAAETNRDIYQQYETISTHGAIIYRRPLNPVRRFQAALPNPPRGEPPPSSVPTVSPRPAALPSAGSLFARGRKLLSQGRYSDAITYLEATIDKDISLTTACLWRIGRIHAALGNIDRGMLCCQMALSSDELCAEAHYTMALLNAQLGKTDQALVSLRKALYIEPNFALAHFALANIHEQSQRLDEARRLRIRALRIASRKPGDEKLIGSDTITAGNLLLMLQTTNNQEFSNGRL